MPNASKRSKLLLRDKLASKIRDYFHEAGFIEVHTPVRVQNAALEDYIDAMPSGQGWLRTSPEIHMKQMLADGFEKIFQLGPCFRANESGHKHRQEFYMLEWYEINKTYEDLLFFTTDMMRYLADAIFNKQSFHYQSHSVKLSKDPIINSVDQAFKNLASCSVDQAIKNDVYEIELCTKVEPSLAKDRLVYLKDYPASEAAMAVINDQGLAERWELYLCGLELANCYTELNDPIEQGQRFLDTAKLRSKDKRDVYDIDQTFLNKLGQMPAAAGCALGFDRLVMLFSDSADINEVNAFPDEMN